MRGILSGDVKGKGKLILYCIQRVTNVQKLLTVFQAFCKVNRSGKPSPPPFLKCCIKEERIKANGIK